MAELPQSPKGAPIQLTPATIALARSINASLSASTTISFNVSATIIRFYAIAQDVYLKWGTTAVTTSNFDEIIPAGQIVDLVIPVQTGTTLYTGCRVIERASGATLIEIEK